MLSSLANQKRDILRAVITCSTDMLRGSIIFRGSLLFLCFGGIFNIPPTPFGYEMIMANSWPHWLSTISYQMRARGIVIILSF